VRRVRADAREQQPEGARWLIRKVRINQCNSEGAAFFPFTQSGGPSDDREAGPFLLFGSRK